MFGKWRANKVKEVTVYYPTSSAVDSWPAGTTAHQVLADIRSKLSVNTGVIRCNGITMSGHEQLSVGAFYVFVLTEPDGTAFEVGNTALPTQYDGCQNKGTQGGNIAVKVQPDPSWRQQQLHYQQNLPNDKPIFKQPDQELDTQVSQNEHVLMQAFAQMGFRPVNRVISYYLRHVPACWQDNQLYIGLSSSSKHTRRGSDGSRRGSDGSRRGSGSSGATSPDSNMLNSGSNMPIRRNSRHNSRRSSSHDASDLNEVSIPAVYEPYKVFMEPFSPQQDTAEVRNGLRDQAKGLTAFIRYPKSSLRADMLLSAQAAEWQQHQQVLAVAAAGMRGGSSPAAGPGQAIGLANTSSTQQSIAAAVAPRPPPAPMRQSSAAAIAAASPTVANSNTALLNRVVLVTGELKPASVACQAWGMSQEDFLSCIASCDVSAEPEAFDLAAQCQAGNQKALEIVSQAVGYAFFTGTKYFMISTYSLTWPAELVSVKEVAEADGSINLEADVKLAPTVFGKSSGPEQTTARGTFGFLAEMTINQPYSIRQIARPDNATVTDAEAGVDQQDGFNDDGLSDDDNTDNRRGNDNDGLQQQYLQQQQRWQQQQQRGNLQGRQQSHQQQQQRGHQHKAVLGQPLKQFTYQHLQLHSLISDGYAAQVFRGVFNGQQAIIKTLGLDWEPAGSYVHEAVMYDLLHGLQLAGMLPRLLGHGRYYNLRYFMAFTEAPGSPLSQLPEPYSREVQQAVQDAVARMHESDVIHDDLHKENIFVQLEPGASPKVTIIDLGRAQLVSTADRKQREMQRLRQMLQC